MNPIAGQGGHCFTLPPALRVPVVLLLAADTFSPGNAERQPAPFCRLRRTEMQLLPLALAAQPRVGHRAKSLTLIYTDHLSGQGKSENPMK